MTLPTILVLIFLVNGQVYQEIQTAPSKEICEQALTDIKSKLVKGLGQEPEAFSATCVTLKPFTRDT